VGAYTFHLEHITPRKKGGDNSDHDLAFSCWNCNKKKVDDTDGRDPQSDEMVALFNPRTENWDTHFECDQATKEILGKTACGRATIERLQMNNPAQIEARTLWEEIGIWP